MPKYDVRADTQKNRLYLVLNGFFSEDEAKEAADKTIREAKKLQPGFDVINDISAFKPASPRGAEEIKRAALFVRKHGVARIIRVVPSTTIGSMQFARKSREVGYDAGVASSIEEAEKILGPWWQKSAS
jgi:hypothetical protein